MNDLLPERVGTVGVSAKDNRLFVSDISLSLLLAAQYHFYDVILQAIQAVSAECHSMLQPTGHKSQLLYRHHRPGLRLPIPHLQNYQYAKMPIRQLPRTNPLPLTSSTVLLKKSQLTTDVR